MDQISQNKIAKLHPKIRFKVTQALLNLEKRNVTARIVQGLRTWAEQDALYAQGRTAPGKIVTNAKAGQSYHNYGLAVDFALLHKDGSISWNMLEDLDKDKKADWLEVVEEFEKLGFSWGGHWKHPDNPHFEMTFGYNFRALAEFVKSGKVDKNGYVLI